jgi:hypothetical protein
VSRTEKLYGVRIAMSATDAATAAEAIESFIIDFGGRAGWRQHGPTDEELTG